MNNTTKEMKNETYSIGEFASKTGVPIRTLHYYDETGVFRPAKRPGSGHRIYTTQDISALQQVLSLKFLGFSLEQIRQTLYHSGRTVSLSETLRLHRQALEARKAEIEASLQAVNRTLKVLDEEGEADSTLLFSLIRNIQLEKQQREWLEQQISLPPGSKLNSTTQEQLDKQFVQLVKEIRRLTGRPYEDPETAKLVKDYMQLIHELVGREGTLALTEVPQDEIDKLEGMFHTPYSDEETAWMQGAIAHYAAEHGLTPGEGGGPVE
ncbi:MerR family transcriptional regulator [Paenibacillus sambharensis]|uniref:MerR family transcriptional regulator n=1 Tax=Paenibacillus sambharensis TaxID=1803190 RepID=A0A2W1L939_9BACL|nr:MerR family transcriptional regulator [Paenibacillus sambharensis]PZD96708.1 MerR family transcriptional regulator [Paenibacillus sambharensis]